MFKRVMREMNAKVINFGCCYHAVEIVEFRNLQSFVVLPSH